MLYSEFVKEQMMKLKSSDMTAPQKMKHIAELWKKSKGTHTEMEKTKPKSKSHHSNEILAMMGVDIKKTKPKSKSKLAEKKVVKAMEKMTIPIEEVEKVQKHPIHLLEKAKEKIESKHAFNDDDEIGF
jgi:hypothetical protein